MKDYHFNIFFSQEEEGYIADIPDLPINISKFIASRLQTAPIELSEMPRISLNSKDLLMPPVFYKHCVPNGTFFARLSDHHHSMIDLV